eukprot:scaffold5310_cov54-Attheya_sp.AAC.4
MVEKSNSFEDEDVVFIDTNGEEEKNGEEVSKAGHDEKGNTAEKVEARESEQESDTVGEEQEFEEEPNIKAENAAGLFGKGVFGSVAAAVAGVGSVYANARPNTTEGKPSADHKTRVVGERNGIIDEIKDLLERAMKRINRIIAALLQKFRGFSGRTSSEPVVVLAKN